MVNCWALCEYRGRRVEKRQGWWGWAGEGCFGASQTEEQGMAEEGRTSGKD